jgi:hypothetical protein
MTFEIARLEGRYDLVDSISGSTVECKNVLLSAFVQTGTNISSMQLFALRHLRVYSHHACSEGSPFIACCGTVAHDPTASATTFIKVLIRLATELIRYPHRQREKSSRHRFL